MRILLSSLLFLLIGCASYPSKNGFVPLPKSEVGTTTIQQKKTNPYFSDTTKDYIYKAQIEAFKNTFSGILAIKKLGEAHHRLAFTTEMGNTIFDFTFQGDTFKVNSILSKLDRKIVVNILKRDFLALITENPKIDETFKKNTEILQNGTILNKNHYYFIKNQELSKIVRTGNGKEKLILQFSEINDNIAGHIEIVHTKIKLKITLNAI